MTRESKTTRKVSRARSRSARAGVTLPELVVMIAVLAVLGALSMPVFAGYVRTSTVKAGAQELVALLNKARQHAIVQNQSVCVATDGSSPSTFGSRVRYVVGTTSCTSVAPTAATCAQTGGATPCVWIGTGTTGDGYMALSNRVQVVPPATAVSFTHLGAAIGGTFRVKNPADQGTATVTVAVSGRVNISYP